MSVVYVPPESGYSRECHQNGWAAPGSWARLGAELEFDIELGDPFCCELRASFPLTPPFIWW